MVALVFNMNRENSEDLKLKPSEYFFCLMQIKRQFKDCNQFKGSNQKIKDGVSSPYFFLAFIMDENQIDEISIVGYGDANKKERDKMVF